jgi:hypothetical protein
MTAASSLARATYLTEWSSEQQPIISHAHIMHDRMLTRHRRVPEVGVPNRGAGPDADTG